MNNKESIILRDLSVLEVMANEMGDYLDNDTLDWVLPHFNKPKLTIGGYLMRQERLGILSHLFEARDQQRLNRAVILFNSTLDERIVRFELRANQELHKRIGEWMGHMRELGSHTFSQVGFYSGITDIRVVINHLMEKLNSKPFQLDEGIVSQVAAVDKNLRSRVETHPFIWDPIWQPAYPPEIYWWLYSCPKTATRS